MADRFGTQQHLQFIRGGSERVAGFPQTARPPGSCAAHTEISNWTTVDLGVDLLNRPHFFRMAQFHAGISYEWNYSRRASNQFTPFRLTFSKLIRAPLMSSTPSWGRIPLWPSVFQSQFIPEMNYTYNYERWLEAVAGQRLQLHSQSQGGRKYLLGSLACLRS